MNNKTLNLKNRIEELQVLNEFIQDFTKTHLIDEQTVYTVNLSLEEIFTNIVRYGYKNHQPHDIVIHFSCRGKTLSISIEDDGIPFNPFDIPEPDTHIPLQDRQIGGLGIHLVKSLVDRISYERKNNKNRLTIEKKINR